MIVKRLKLVLCFILLSMAALGQTRTEDCSAFEFNELNYWLGEWIIQDSLGTVIGESKVSKNETLCSIEEQREDNEGGSFNQYFYKSSLDEWQTTWTDESGDLLLFIGSGEEDVMFLQSKVSKFKGLQMMWIQRDAYTVEKYLFLIDDSGNRLKLLSFEIYRKSSVIKK